MVMRKRLDNGSSGFQVSTIPRAPRSLRRRGPHKKFVKDNQICAFELLASIAGKLLQECESSSASSNAAERKDQPAIGNNVVKQELKEEVKPIKTEYIEQGICEPSVVDSDKASQSIDQKFVPQELHAESNVLLEGASIPTSSDYSDKVRGVLKSEICKSTTLFENSICKIEAGSPNYGESCNGNLGNVIGDEPESGGKQTGDIATADICSSRGSEEFSDKIPDLSSYGKPPTCMDPAPSSLAFRHTNGVSLGDRDDDEKNSSYSKPPSKMRFPRPPSRIGDRRIRKLLTSRYWKVAPKLKDCEMSNSDGGGKPVYHKRKTSCHRENRQHDIIYKRRKLFDRSSVVTSDGGFSSESVSNSPEKGISGDKSTSATRCHGVSSSALGHQTSIHSKGSHVKFSIKSFKVPELYIEVPETTTVGSLKRTVMEAVTAILGGGLRVGVVLQGKKVRDDNRTLLQTGISCKDNLDSLGFMLEPNAIQAPPPMRPEEDPPLPLSCVAPPLATRSLPAPDLDLEVSNPLPDPLSLATLGDHLESNHESVSSHTDTLTDNAMPESRALVPIPAMSMEALAVVPLNQKPRRSELVQRRTRRPFSVAEVEALVEAVEQLGTGRWRDVKLCAFEDADHRTYVDLKDKWKTLVHTAKIAPQQRRGEPVPQELLDRVLAAHRYWSQPQSRQQGKHHSGAQKTTQAVVDTIGA